MKGKIYSAREGYNIIAPFYDKWKWQQFWHLNEYPYIEKWCNTLKIGEGLDVGTGSGNNLKCFLDNGQSVTAIDISSEMLRICKLKYASYINTNNLKCLELDIREIYPYERKYDWILSNRVISHLNIFELSEVIKKISSIIKFGGQCFISDIHPLHKYSETNIQIGNDEVCIETYKHSIEEIKQVIKRHNFEILKFKEINVLNLTNKEILKQFPNLLNQETPIFYYTIIKYIG